MKNRITVNIKSSEVLSYLENEKKNKRSFSSVIEEALIEKIKKARVNKNNEENDSFPGLMKSTHQLRQCIFNIDNSHYLHINSINHSEMHKKISISRLKDIRSSILNSFKFNDDFRNDIKREIRECNDLNHLVCNMVDFNITILTEINIINFHIAKNSE